MVSFDKGAAWIKGEIVPISEASIPANDWGVTHSDCVYDVAGVNDGAFFRLQDHIARFLISMQKVHMEVDQSAEDIRNILHEIVGKSGLKNSYASMVTSRGVPMMPGSRDPRDCANHFFAWCVPYVHVFKPEVAERGSQLHIPNDVFRIPPDSVDPTVKNYHWGDMTRGLIEALDKGFDSVALTDHQGNLTEGPGFNLFAVYGNRLVTPQKGVLQGITRRTVMEIAENSGMKLEVRDLPLAEFYEADEVFTATTGGGVCPVVKVNERTFSNGAPGVKTLEIAQSYQDWLRKPEFCDQVDYG